MKCTRKGHKTQGAAIMFQQSLKFSDPFYVYKCNACNLWHVSLQGVTEQNEEDILKLIKTGSPLCTHIKKISNKKSLWHVRYGHGNFEVIYHKSKKGKPAKVRVLGNIY